MAAREGTLWPHQWESFLRVVYAHEVLGKAEIGGDGLLLNIVTGGGKTAVIAAVTAWLRIAHDVQKLVMLCPNLIVRDRLEDDFQGGKVFTDRSLLPDWSTYKPGDFALTTLGGSGGRLGQPLQRQRDPGQHPPVLVEQQERAEQPIGADERAWSSRCSTTRRTTRPRLNTTRRSAECGKRSRCAWIRRRPPTAPTGRRRTAT